MSLRGAFCRSNLQFRGSNCLHPICRNA